MQLDNFGKDENGNYILANANQIWNWKDNIAAAKTLLQEKYTMAINYPKKVRARGGAYSNATDFTPEQLMQDIFRLYNGYHDWRWNNGKDDWDVIKYWKDKKHTVRDLYSEKAMEIYQDVINGNPLPSDWNN